VPEANTKRNKETVARLFEIIYGSVEAIPAIDDLVAPDYIQHNPLAGQGREGLREFLCKIVPEPKELDAAGTLSVNLIAEGDYVVRQEIRTNGMLVDIFRMKDGLCQEHWDAFRFAPGARRIAGF
jgi:predicted SnoaL-like aldol condensation-catalyzing enzyme